MPLFLPTNFFTMNDLMNQLNETVNYIKSRVDVTTKIGIVLGSGLGNLSQVIDVEEAIEYADIPHFPVSTVKGHGGKLLFGKLGGTNVMCMSGRFHFYEGYSAQQVIFPVRVMKLLGIETLLLSNAAGGVNPNYKVGDLMVINDHISFFTTNPLIGKNVEELGTRFPDMSEPYCKALIAKALEIGVANNIQLHQGVYTAVTGPTFETHAEYRLIKVIGSDVVGMSTVQESIAAVHCGMKVFAVSVVTDLGIREDDNIITHEEVLQAAKEAEPKLTTLFTELAKAVG
jgi:purine-nucleoside phosphorylase